MKRGELKKSYGPQGPAVVTVGKRSVAVLMQETRIKYEFPLEAVPEYIVQNWKNGLLKVSLSEDGAKVMACGPWEGKVICKFDKIAGATEGSIPTPKVDNSPGHTKDGREYPRNFMKWGALINIVGPATYLGQSAYCAMLYYDPKRGGFAPDEANMLQLVGKHRDVQKLDDFLQAVGLGNFSVPYSDNLLPAIQTGAWNADREFAVDFAEGWPNTFEAIPQQRAASKSVKQKPATQKEVAVKKPTAKKK